MSEQVITSYTGRFLSDITTAMMNDSFKLKRPVQSVSLTSYVVSYSVKYAAIVIFGEEKTNEPGT